MKPVQKECDIVLKPRDAFRFVPEDPERGKRGGRRCRSGRGRKDVRTRFVPQIVGHLAGGADESAFGAERLAERAHEDVRAEIETGEQRRDAVSAGPDDADGCVRVEIGPDGTLFIMR